ncbi:hypothetical protein [Nostoc sp. UHCC 0251]|uniref:hypothetical protein n=1 Tax=Nostoc sp. UHCC 0251 TaxID=3110240 RepID=UPI002B1F92FC|nr:hypothetical protein [Nostoc sp. UHCC 0251]MEA5623247.1 hypothetical protein [Nostoc sp. UHCC 0251]
MSNSKHSDIEIEILLLGKWRFDTFSEKVTIEFKDDMTYEQTKIQMLFFSKPKELLTGNKFTGVWYVRQNKLHLNVRTMPKSFFNFSIPLVFKISLADIVATLNSIFTPENYEVIEINDSKFIIKDQEESIIGTKLKRSMGTYV